MIIRDSEYDAGMRKPPKRGRARNTALVDKDGNVRILGSEFKEGELVSRDKNVAREGMVVDPEVKPGYGRSSRNKDGVDRYSVMPLIPDRGRSKSDPEGVSDFSWIDPKARIRL